MAYLRAEEGEEGEAQGGGASSGGEAAQQLAQADGGDVDMAEAGAYAGAGADAGAAAGTEACAASIVFLYKLIPGAADESFGLNVAQLAGLPSSVVQRAAVIARQFKQRLGAEAAAAATRNRIRALLRRLGAAAKAGASVQELGALQEAAVAAEL
jgi:hypothetical protein